MEIKSQLTALTDFLLEYQWIYNFKLTEFFVDRMWEQIPKEWIPCLISLSVEEMNQIPFGYKKDDWPESLLKFLHSALSLSINRKKGEVTPEVKLDQKLRKGMNPKKQHEVSRMAALVHDLARQTGSDVIVDVGSGLGYLGQTLCQVYGHTVIGIEGKQCHTTSAEKRSLTSDKSINMTFELQNTTETMANFKQAISETMDKLNISAKMKILETALQSEGEITLKDCNQLTSNIRTRENTEDIIKQCVEFNKEADNPCEQCQDKHISDNGSLSDESKGKIKCDDCPDLSLKDGDLQYLINPCNNYRQNDTDICHKDKNSKESMEQCNYKMLCRIPEKSCHSDIVTENSMNGCHGDTVTENSIKGCHGDTVTENAIQCCLSQNRLTRNFCHSDTSTSLDSSHSNTSANHNVLMIGLHCCGDLTPTMMRYFSELDFISGLCCVSCCYHRMKCDDQSKKIDNFPLSAALRSFITETTQLNLYAMRLGAQETRSRWENQSSEDHDYHMKNVAYRGILALCCKQESCDHHKLFRKLTRRSDLSCFVSYVDAVLKRTNLQSSGEEIHKKLMDLHTEYEKYFNFIEPFTMLQVMIQPVIETLIYLDRQQWLTEHNHYTDILSVFDDNISPRNLALIAYKASNHS